jgi:diaminopimelate epimerase
MLEKNIWTWNEGRRDGLYFLIESIHNLYSNKYDESEEMKEWMDRECSTYTDGIILVQNLEK